MKKVGGQAVIEGVLMQSDDKVSVSVRKGKKIVNRVEKRHTKLNQMPWKLPLLRGMVALVEMMAVGIKMLNWSASVNNDEKELSKGSTVLTIIFSIGFALILFKLLPLTIAQLLTGINVFSSRVIFNIVEGSVKVLVFVLYLAVIGLFNDVKQVFRYHGAEHKAVNCYEANEPLTVSNAMKFTTLNPRCGTSFILFVLLISIIVYMFLPINLNFIAKYSLRILLLPVIAGVSYEVLRLSDRYKKNFFVQGLIKPGLMLQKLTTKEPDREQVQVALNALKKCIKE